MYRKQRSRGLSLRRPATAGALGITPCPQTEALLLQTVFHVEKGVHGAPNAFRARNSQHPTAGVELAHLRGRNIDNGTWHRPGEPPDFTLRTSARGQRA